MPVSPEMNNLPLLPLRDVVVYPHMVVPLFVGRETSIAALESAMEADDKGVILVAQKDGNIDEPSSADLYEVGTYATILQLLNLPDGTVKVLVEGVSRAKILNTSLAGDFFTGSIELLENNDLSEKEESVLVNTLNEHFDNYINVSKKVPNEVLSTVSGIDDINRLADTIAAHMSLSVEQKQVVLDLVDTVERVEYLLSLMDSEVDLSQVEKRIRGRVKKQMEKSQREYYLNEQMKAIQKELGDMDDVPNEIEEIEKKIAESGMPKEALDKVNAEVAKLKQMSAMSAEAAVVRNYIDWMIRTPWKNKTKSKYNLEKAKDILEKDHYGLDEVKERVLEYLAVQKRVKKLKGPVLCFVGPPGVGKTSLGESIAAATNRKFVRIALGGVRDEAEIRGHRRTYIGSMPGKIIQKLAKTGVKNPLVLLDEIDKMGMDNRGDPASALLEVLDPEQNHTFNDHYLEVDYDLSDVMFICTSNSMNIPGPLLDRMEVIRIPGYTEDEKVNIVQRYLAPKQLKNNGLKDSELTINEAVIRDLIRFYTREAGVRGLEREVAKVCRKVVKQFALSEAIAPVVINSESLENYSGVRKFNYGRAEDKNQIGQVTGLAWTSVGGELLTIEAVAVKGGKGRVVKTGSLGDVMQESIQAAITVVRSRSQLLGITAEAHDIKDLHIHIPEGATPKDGPSAGIGMCTALVSVLTDIPVKAEVAMTGEITLRGEVLPIGGLKEKLLAAHRGNIKTVIIPSENERDLKEVPDNIKADLQIIPVKWIDQVLEIALESIPVPLSDEEYLAKTEFDSASGTDEKSSESTGKRVNPH